MKKAIVAISVGFICFYSVTTPVAAQEATPSESSELPEENDSGYPIEPISAVAAALIAASSALLLPISKEFSKKIEQESSAFTSKKIQEIAKLVKAESEREKSAAVRAITTQPQSAEALSEIEKKIEKIELETSELSRPIQSAIEELVTSYHSQALRQAGIQFYFSVAAATVGFALIIYSAISAVNTDNPRKLLDTFPGAIISGVSALFFKQAEDTRRRATDLYDRLRSDERQSQAVSIADRIESQEFRSLVQAQLVLQLADVKDAKPIDLGSQISKLVNIKHSPSLKEKTDETE